MSLAFIFPGQGSQSKGMLGELAAVHPIIEQTYDEASDALGYSLWDVCQQDADGRLSQTEVTQPALLTASVALWRLWQSQGGQLPSMMAGHSLGEYSALACAGSIEFIDAVKLVRRRGQLMQSAVAEGAGAMAAVLGLDDEVVVEACRSVSAGVVSAANFNAPGQVVIAGERNAVDAAIEHCKEAGARRALPLPVSVPSHCALMQPAADAFADELAQINVAMPTLPVINNVDVAIVDSPDAIRDALVRQLHSPVRWVEVMRRLAQDGAMDALECGPGKVLSGLQKRIDKNLNTHSVDVPDSFNNALGTLKKED